MNYDAEAMEAMNDRNEYRPSFTIYNPNAKGTGSAMKLRIIPAGGHAPFQHNDGFIIMRLANQKTVGDSRGPNPTYPTFDWENSVDVLLHFDDIVLILQVWRGETESVNDGKGMYIREYGKNTVVKFGHYIDYHSGYKFEVCQNCKGEKEERRCQFWVTSAQSLGLCTAIESAMASICFGYV